MWNQTIVFVGKVRLNLWDWVIGIIGEFAHMGIKLFPSGIKVLR
jgi:hypothetical protein